MKSWQVKACLLSFVSALAFLPAAASAQETAPADETALNERIVVTGQSLSISGETNPLPVTVLSGDELAHRRRSTLGETLDGLPGVHMDNFGAGASRPVIRGQTVPRIEILSDGANLFDASAASPDHAIVTDPLLLDAIEIQRGPAAVRYGGNAVNGAINLIDGKVPKSIPEGGITGAAELRFGTADDENSAAGRVTAALGPIVFHAEGSYSGREDYNVPGAFGTDRLKDSFAESSSYAFGASLILPQGYIGAAYTRQDAEYGLPGHSHKNGSCHTHGTDLHCTAHGEFGDPFFGSDDDHTAYIDLRSERVDIRADLQHLLPGIDHTRVRLSYTDYVHDEIDGPFLFSRYTNEAYDARLELTHAPILGFTGMFGAQYTDGTFSGLNYNDAHEVEPDLGFVQPLDYVTENFGIFLNERASFGAIDIDIAARKDWREISVTVPTYNIRGIYVDLIKEVELLLGYGEGGWIRMQTEAFLRNNPGAKHDPFSASVAATWNVGEGYSAALSLAHSERAPSVRELYAYGNNLATNSYELGLSQTRRGSSSFPAARTDVLETAQSVNLTFRKAGGPLEFEVGLFHQDIDDYVFARLIETDTETGIPHHYLIYTAADARFTGIDGQVSYRFSPESRATLFGDYVGTRLKNEDDNLPRISPGRLGARYDWSNGPISADVEYYRTFAQGKVASYETPTDGYDMVNATLAYRFDVKGGGELELYMRGSNLTNELAFVHTSFVKDQSPLRGRNITFGLRQLF